MNRRAGAFAVLLGAALHMVVPAPALAADGATGLVYGWWTQEAAAGLGSSTSPDVPADGMLVHNAPAGPLAISAVRFVVPDGGQGAIELVPTGNPVQTQAPQACRATSSFTAAQGGAWGDRPTYDCATPVTATMAGNGFRIDVTSLARNGSVSVAILAGGSADRVAFQRPVVRVTSPTGVTTGPAPGPAPAPAAGGQVTVPLPPVVQLPPVLAPLAAPAVLPVPQLPVAAPPSVASHTGPVISVPPVLAAQPEPRSLSIRRSLGGAAGVALIVVFILYWTEGFGAMSLRWSRTPRQAVA